MNERQVRALLEFFTRKARGAKAKWALCGSANLLVQGIKADPKDLDIATTANGINEFKRIFAPHVVREFRKHGGRALECRVRGLEIEFVSTPLQLKKIGKSVPAKWKGLRIRILPLPEALRFYLEAGEKRKAEAIARHLAGEKKGNL